MRVFCSLRRYLLFFCLFLRSYDNFSFVSNRFEGLKLELELDIRSDIR